MEAGTRTGEHRTTEQPTAQMPSAIDGGNLLTSAIGDSCANCGNPLAADQRYCLECGERRGRARFSLGSTQPRSAAAPSRRAVRRFGAGVPIGGEGSGSATLVAGIATLLLAMGVGVLIGHGTNNSNNSKAPAAPQVITVNGGGGVAGAAATTSSTPTTATPHSGASKSSGKKKSTTSSTAAAASSGGVITTVKNLPPAKVTTGSTCSPGQAGCSSSGKFTGNFFGQ